MRLSLLFKKKKLVKKARASSKDATQRGGKRGTGNEKHD
jgi:hypothetical protein